MARRHARLIARLAGAALTPLAWGSLVSAQEATPAAPAATPAPAKDKATETTVGEVVVTATRQAQSLSKVPASVSAFTAEKMEVQGIKNFDQIAMFTPGVTFNNDSNNISIRGVASSWTPQTSPGGSTSRCEN